MQQPSTISYYYQSIYNQDGGGGPAQWLQDNNKPNQFQSWENNSGFHVTSGNSYGSSQVQGGGGQNRVPVPQQSQQPSQPPPTSTPPGIHGDMSKQPLMPNQQAQMNYVQARPNLNFSYPRGAMTQPPQMRAHNRVLANSFNLPIGGVLTPAPTQATIVQAMPFTPLMYGQPRQSAQYPAQGQFMLQQQFFNAQATPHYFPQVLPPQSYQGMTSGGPSPQAGVGGQGVQGNVPIMRSNIVASAPVPQPMKQEPKKRTHAIKIIDPITNEEVPVDPVDSGNNNNITPTRSNDSSARETPQPNAGITLSENAVAADFAARVAAVAVEPATPVPTQDNVPSECESVPHKQQPLVVPSSEKIFNTVVLSTSSEEFVPRSFKQVQPPPCEPPVQEQVPTVSADTDSPAVEIQRTKEPFPILKNPPVVQSPVRGNPKKQKSEVVSAQVLPPPVEEKEQKESNKKVPKGETKEENVPLAVPKEKREKEKTKSFSKEQSPAPSTIISSEIAPSVQASAAVAKSVPPAPRKDLVGTYNLPVLPVSMEEPAVPVKTLHQNQNGETPLPEPALTAVTTVDGNKTSRQKNKKTNKMRDLNRKGVEKEGSEMDAFTTEPTIVPEDKERPATPASPTPSIKKSSSPPPPQNIEVSAPSSPVNKIKEDLEEKEDKMVAAKNEENIKVSALSKAEEEPVPIIEKSIPQLTLRHSYKKDQWSPINPEGKKKYERDFLFELKGEPQSNIKPDNLPDVVAVLRDSSNNMRNNPNLSFLARGDRGLMPDFSKGSQSQRGSLPKGRGSQQGNKGKNNPKVITMSLSLHEDVKLKTAENAWKPARFQSDAEKSEEERQTAELYKNVRGILNKLTPQKFDTLMKRFMMLPINSEERLKGVIDLIFEKAVDEPNFSKAYANMCKICSRMEVSKVENGTEQKVNFRKILITRCQNEFESNKSSELDASKRFEEINNCTDPEQKKELTLAYEEKERSLRRKSVGNIRFIGELFKLSMLTPTIMYRCIEHLLSTTEEESLECLCKLLTTIGKDLEQSNSKGPQPVSLNPYFQKMNELAQKKDGSKVSSRVRFMLQDVIELRQNKWVPRREDNNPKTIEQITKEAERESLEMSMALSQPIRINRQNDRQDDRKRGNRGNNQSEDGWTNVSNSRYHSSSKYTPAFDAAKMQIKQEVNDLTSLSLGGSQQFRFQNPAKVESKPSATFTSSNVFSALSRGDERKPPPQPNMNNRRITPTPSIERDRERQRMVLGGTEGEGLSSRGSSAHRERPQPPSSQPPSRDSSVSRQVPTNKDNRDVESAGKSKREEDKKNNRIVDEKAARLAEEKLERQTNTIFDEFLNGLTSIEDVKQDIEQLYHAENIGTFIQKALDISLEKKAGTQKRIGLLITALMDFGLFTPEVIADKLSLVYENAEDIAIDVPKVWALQAQVIVPILAARKMNFSHFKDACSSVLKTPPAVKLLVPVLTLLAEEKGPGFVRNLWDSSNVSLKELLPSSISIDAFIQENSLQYLTGEAPNFESDQLTMDQVQEKMLRLMQNGLPCEKVNELISSNVGDQVKSLQFIRALITAICEACITGTNYNFDITRFKQYEKLIQKYVDNKEDRELICLNSVHILLSKLEHPQGLIKSIFNQLFEDNLISCDSFLKWKDDDQEKLKNKGVSIYALTSFFSALEEVDTDDDNNS